MAFSFWSRSCFYRCVVAIAKLRKLDMQRDTKRYEVVAQMAREVWNKPAGERAK